MDNQIVDNLILKAQSGNAEAIEDLLNIFRPKVTAISREYFLVGADFDDLIQESMIGLFKAINIYDAEKNKSFGPFASLCIHRQLQNAVKLANRKKNNPLNNYLPIRYFDGTSATSDEDFGMVIVDDTANIEQNFIDREMKMVVVSRVKSILSKEEFDILRLFLNGEKYEDIARKTNITTKKVDNTLQSIKKKLRAIEGEI